jgi:hypothetical protein
MADYFDGPVLGLIGKRDAQTLMARKPVPGAEDEVVKQHGCQAL